MDLKTPFVILRRLLIAGVITCAASQGLAQTNAQPVNPVEVHKQTPQAPARVWIKDPNQVMPMRQMTNAQRREAAERSRARRAKAEAQRKLNNQNSQSGVQR
jgi:hypothetical protein